MGQMIGAARGLVREGSRQAPAWLACLDLACTVSAALLWALVPAVGPYPLLLALLPAAVRLGVTGRLGRRTPFDLPLGLFLLTAAVAVWSAYDRPAAWAKFWLIAGGVLLYYALANASVLGTRRAWLPAALGAAIAVYFVMTNDWQMYPGEIAVLAHRGEALQGLVPAIPGPRLNPNEAGGLLALLAPFAGWVLWHAWQQAQAHREARPLLGLLGVALASLLLFTNLVALVMTGSRGAWLALAVGLYAAGAWLAAGRLAGQRGGRRLAAWVGLLLAGLLLAVLAVALLVRTGLWGAGLLDMYSLFDRVEWYRYSFLLAKDYAFVGAGLNNFLMLYASYALLTHVGYIFNAHSLFLGVAIAQGIPGLLALAWMWGVLASLAWRQAWQQGREARGWTSAAAPLMGIAAACVAIALVHGLAESALYGSGVFLLSMPLAFALPDDVPGAEPVRARSKRAALAALSVTLALVLLVVLVGPRSLLAQWSANLGAVRQGQAELSVYSWPEWWGQDDVRRAVDLDRSVAELERALALDPANGTANRRLGMIELSLGEYEDALGHLAAAYDSEDWSVTTRQLLGEALVVNGRLDEGRALWADVNNGQRQLVYRAEWYKHIGEGEREAAVRQAAAGY